MFRKIHSIYFNNFLEALNTFHVNLSDYYQGSRPHFLQSKTCKQRKTNFLPISTTYNLFSVRVKPVICLYDLEFLTESNISQGNVRITFCIK